VQRALRIGFSLAELAEVLKARDAGDAPCRRVYQLAQDKLKGIEADIEALKRTRRYVKKVCATGNSALRMRVRERNRTCCIRSLTR
jgi:DNA-binding transcriptional MerR regulator